MKQAFDLWRKSLKGYNVHGMPKLLEAWKKINYIKIFKAIYLQTVLS